MNNKVSHFFKSSKKVKKIIIFDYVLPVSYKKYTKILNIQ